MRGVARARVTSSRRRTTLHGVRTFLLALSRNGLGAPIAVSEAKRTSWSKENRSVLFLLVVFACVSVVLFLPGRTLIGSPREGIILGRGAILLRNLVFFRRAFLVRDIPVIVGDVVVLARDGFSGGTSKESIPLFSDGGGSLLGAAWSTMAMESKTPHGRSSTPAPSALGSSSRGSRNSLAVLDLRLPMART